MLFGLKVEHGFLIELIGVQAKLFLHSTTILLHKLFLEILLYSMLILQALILLVALPILVHYNSFNLKLLTLV